MSKITIPLVLTALGVAGAVVADEHDEQTELEEIIVTASPLARTSDQLTQPAVVLDKEALLLKSSNSLGETLANEPGVSASYFGPVAGRPIIRGQAGPRISVLEGGVSSLDVADLSPDHAVPIEPLFADAVEIIRGPATLLYGSGAVGGVVNVRDGRIPERLTDSPLSGAVELRADTVSNQRAIAARLDGSSGWLGWHLNGFERRSDDIDIPGFATALPAERPPEERSGTVANSFGESSGFSGGASWIGERGFVGVSLSEFSNRYGLPGPGEEEEEEPGEPAIAAGPFIDLEQTRLDLRARLDFEGLIESLKFSAGHNDYQHNEIEPSGEIGTTFDNDAWEARLELTHAMLAGRWRGALGAQITRRDFSAIGEEAFVPPVRTDSEGWFALEEMSTGFGFVEFGARVERLTHEPDSAAPAYRATARSLAAGLKWTLTDAYDLNANFARTERHPAASELYATGAHLATGLYEIGLLSQGEAAVIEVSRNLDVALHYHSDALDWRVALFYNDIDDYLFLQTGSDVIDGLPVALYQQEDARFYGIEAELSWYPAGVDSPWSMHWLADQVRAKADGEPLPRIQPARLGARLQYDQPGWAAGVRATYHAEQDDISSFETDAFTMLDADVIWRLDATNSLRWDVFLKASNLLDEDARRSTSFRAAFVPLPGRALQLGVRGRFN